MIEIMKRFVLFAISFLVSFMPAAAQYFSIGPSEEILKGDVASYEVETVGIQPRMSISITGSSMSASYDTLSIGRRSVVHVTLDKQGHEIERLIYLGDVAVSIPGGITSTSNQGASKDDVKLDTKTLRTYYDNGRLKQRKVLTYWTGTESVLAKEDYEYVDDENGQILKKICRNVQGNETVETYYRTGEKIDSVEIVRKGNGTEAKRLEKYLYLDDNGSVFIYDGNVPAPSLIMIERNIYDSKGRLTVHTDNREVDFNTFYYDNGEVFMTSDVNSDGSREWVIYDSYKFDDHGNWIYRIAYRTMPSTTTPEGKVSGGNLAASSVTTRTITYR